MSEHDAGWKKDVAPPEPGSRPLGAPPLGDVPAPGDWPCQTAPEPRSERLVAFLYVLLRDGMKAPGDVEQVAINVSASGHDERVEYTNPHLESYARALATRLTPYTAAVYPHPDGDFMVLGPEIFAGGPASDPVISWRGENFTRQPAPTSVVLDPDEAKAVHAAIMGDHIDTGHLNRATTKLDAAQTERWRAEARDDEDANEHG